MPYGYGYNSYSAPYEDDPDEEHRRKLELIEAQGAQKRYGDSVAMMEKQRAERLGYGLPPALNRYSDLYAWAEAPETNIGFSIAPDARVLGPGGPEQTELHAPPMRPAQSLGFMPRKRVLAPDAGQRIAMLRAAEGGDAGIPLPEYEQRLGLQEASKKRLFNIQNQADDAQRLRQHEQELEMVAAKLAAESLISIDEARGMMGLQAKNSQAVRSDTPKAAPVATETSDPLNPVQGAAAGANPTPVTEEIQKAPPSIRSQQTPTLEEFAAKYRRRNMNATDEQILKEYRRRGGA